MTEFLKDREIFALRWEQSQVQAMRIRQEQLQASEIKQQQIQQQIQQQQRLQQEQYERYYQGVRRQLAYNARGKRNAFTLPSSRLLIAHS